MTHAINLNTNLLSIDITRMHTQMRNSPRGEKKMGKNGEKQSKDPKKLEKKKK